MLKKALFKMFILILIISTIAACSTKSPIKSSTNSSGTDTDKQLTFAFSIMVLGNPYFISVKQGFEERAKELGIKTIVNDAKYDAATQLSQVENYITQNVDAIAAAPIDQNGLKASFDKAKQEGIFTMGQAQPVDNAAGNLIVNEYEYGKMIGTNAAKWINEKLNGEAEVLLITQDNVEAVKKRGDGIEDAIKELAPNAKIVARQAGDTAELAMGITENVLKSSPNVKVIAAVNDSAGLGAYEAVKAMGIDTTNFYVGAADATNEAIEKMKEENSFYRATVDIDPYGTGKKLVDMMLDGVKNNKEPGTVYFEMKPVWQEDLK